MNRDDIITIVLNRLGNRANDAVLFAEAKRELNLIIQNLESAPDLPWFCLTELSSTTTIGEEARIRLPTDFLLEYEDGDLYILANGNEYELKKKPWEHLREEYFNAATGQPCFYAIVGQYFRLRPVPDQEYTLKMAYYKKATTLSDDVLENVWTQNVPGLLVGDLGIVMAGEYVNDQNKMQVFAQHRQHQERMLINKMVAREERNLERIMGRRFE